jgi:hypothetical protein
MSDIEHVRSELVRIFGSEVADNPRVVAAALQAESLDRAATRLSHALEAIAAALIEPPVEFVEQPNTRPSGLLRPTGDAILR